MGRRHAAKLIAAACVFGAATAMLSLRTAGTDDVDWPVYRGDPQGTQYSSLAQINTKTVKDLQPAWEYHTKDATNGSTMYANPLVINGVMYISTPSLKAVALDPATGAEIWVFDPAKYNDGKTVILRNRGVTYWKGADGERIFHFVGDRVYAIDAKSGALIQSFASDGYIDLRFDLGVDPATAVIQTTSPGAIYRNFLIVASRVNEDYDASPGHIRAYDTVTGQLRWTFHTIPRKGELGYDTWEWVEGENYGGANAWGGLTVDEKRGWVFAATGSATSDFYGGFRRGNNLFANCVLALNATTGERIWHYQTIRHDIWDYDNPAAPVLVTLRSAGTSKDAVVQVTKVGLTFVLDRETGRPLFPVEERPVPQSAVPGEEASPTQPFPLKPPPLVRQSLTEADLTTVTPESRAYALRVFRKYKTGPMYTPPSLQGTLTFPGFWGGAEWGGGAFDSTSNVIYVNVNETPSIHRLRPVYARAGDAAVTPAQRGHEIYANRCVSCHGPERQGAPPAIPSLLNPKLRAAELGDVIRRGRNDMPAFPQLDPPEVSALVAYLATGQDEVNPSVSAVRADRYVNEYPQEFLDSFGAPIISPPWGTLNAVDLVKGAILWKVPLGEYPKLVEMGIRNTGALNFGGPVATAGGLIFIGATKDEKFRAFDKGSGKMLWEYQLPAGGYATPSVYMIDGQQYVAIAAGGGGRNATKAGDSLVAFALPRTRKGE